MSAHTPRMQSFVTQLRARMRSAPLSMGRARFAPLSMGRARFAPLSMSLVCAAVMLAWSSVAFAVPPCATGKGCPRAVSSETARGIALGTGSRASAISTSALSYNPAALALGHLYHVEAAVDYMPEWDAVALGGAVVDSSTAKVGAGFGLRGFLSGDQGMGGIDGRLGIAFPFSNAFSLGLVGRYISISRDQDTVDAKGNPATITRKLAQGFTMDAAFRMQPSDVLQLEVGTINFIDLGSAYVPLQLNMSAAFMVGQLATIGADFIADMTTFDKPAYTVGGGVEVLLGGSVPLRAGYAVDTKRELHSIGAGIGYTDRFVGFDISLQQQVKGGDDTRVIGAFRYYVH